MLWAPPSNLLSVNFVSFKERTMFLRATLHSLTPLPNRDPQNRRCNLEITQTSEFLWIKLHRSNSFHLYNTTTRTWYPQSFFNSHSECYQSSLHNSTPAPDQMKNRKKSDRPSRKPEASCSMRAGSKKLTIAPYTRPTATYSTNTSLVPYSNTQHIIMN